MKKVEKHLKIKGDNEAFILFISFCVKTIDSNKIMNKF